MPTLLLLFDFNVGNLIWWLCGTYPHEHIPIELIQEDIATVRDKPRTAGYHVQDFDRVMYVIEHGTLLQAVFVCIQNDVHCQNLYGNHAGTAPTQTSQF